jgi:SNF2 family DNA or RNA helicase
VSLTLTAAHHELFVETSDDPMEDAQAAKRCHRIGQKNKVFVRFATSEDPIHARIVENAIRKAQDALALFGAGIETEIHARDVGNVGNGA